MGQGIETDFEMSGTHDKTISFPRVLVEYIFPENFVVSPVSQSYFLFLVKRLERKTDGLVRVGKLASVIS